MPILYGHPVIDVNTPGLPDCGDGDPATREAYGETVLVADMTPELLENIEAAIAEGDSPIDNGSVESCCSTKWYDFPSGDIYRTLEVIAKQDGTRYNWTLTVA
ncbi:MAG TPA: hypothetical protein V6C65_14240 [Allocoleopsis sp.]